MKIPFIDLRVQFEDIRGEMLAEIVDTYERCDFTTGANVAEIEKEMAALHGTKYGVAVNGGTAALHLALLGLKMEPNSEVITVPNTFIATAEAIHHAGARPIFVDVKPDTLTMDPELIEEAITSRTRAILPVHLYGQPADMDPILTLAQRHGLEVIEDACQAHLAEYKGRRVGSLGKAAAFSFYPGKNLGAYGEGGMVLTDDEEIARRARSLRCHGMGERYVHNEIGFNYKMDGPSAASLKVKLGHIGPWTEQRRENAKKYNQVLEGMVEIPTEAPYARHVYHVYQIGTDDRDGLKAHLETKGIATNMHYPVPIHKQPAFAKYNRQSFPVVERAVRRSLSLPMYAELTEKQIEYIADAIEEFVRK